MTPPERLWIKTPLAILAEGAAACRGRADIGTLAVGAHRADRVKFAGRCAVEDGLPVGIDLARLRAEHGAPARRFLEEAS